MTFLLHAFKDIKVGNDCSARLIYVDELIDTYAEAWNFIKFELFTIYKAQGDCILHDLLANMLIYLITQ